jgi:hypothetical protein
MPGDVENVVTAVWAGAHTQIPRATAVNRPE